MAYDFIGYRNLGDAFLARVAMHPEKTALTLVRGSAESEAESLSYRELASRAGLRAAELAERLAPGERVVIALPTCTEFVELYLGCLLAGVVAVPAPPVSGSASAAKRVAAIAADCAPALVITPADDRQSVIDRLAAWELGHIPVEAAAAAGSGEAPSAPYRDGVDRDTLAVLQYSSGSTGTPKGVMLAHGHVMANTAVYDETVGPVEDEVFAGWLPLHHDFGFFVQLTFTLYRGGHVVLMPPPVFARRPLDWLRMLDRYRATATGGPNFAFAMACRRVTEKDLDSLDLSRLRFVLNGSEPIYAPTMTEFAQTFARTGLRPEMLTSAYGMAEITVFAAASRITRPLTVFPADPLRRADPVRPELVPAPDGAGQPVVGVDLPKLFQTRIVDPESREALPDGAIGEVWLQGDSVGSGYWNKPELSEETFRARLAGAPGADRGWLRTGDLAAIVDGELFIVGRLKEMLIVRGRNLFPQELEHEAREAHPALAGLVGAVFGVDAPDEQAVLVHEVDPKLPAEDLRSVAAAVTAHLSTAFGVPARNILLVRRGTVGRTTSGKIERTGMRRRFLAGEIEALHTELEPGVRQLLARAAAGV